MGNKLLSFANAFVTPGSVLAIIVGWVATRPDLQLKFEGLWTKIFGHREEPVMDTYRMEPYGNHVSPLHVNVPVSKSRCKVTQAFRPVRLEMKEVA